MAKLDKPSPATSSSSTGLSSSESSPTGHRPPPKPVGKHDQFPLRSAQDQFRRAMSSNELDGSPASQPVRLPRSMSQSATYPLARLTPREFFQGRQQQTSDDFLERQQTSSSSDELSRACQLSVAMIAKAALAGAAETEPSDHRCPPRWRRETRLAAALPRTRTRTRRCSPPQSAACPE